MSAGVPDSVARLPGTELPPSLWAAVSPPGAEHPRLEGEVRADVAVIGAGVTGLSAALHLAETGTDVAVIEAAEPGWGASGRNNGQVIPALSKPNPDALVARWGETGERFVAMLRDCADDLFGTLRRLGIDAEAEQAGWMQPAHSPGRVKISEERVRQWSKYGAPVELLSREQVRDMTGSDLWHGGFWNRSGGHVNPLAMTRGLARAVTVARGRIYAQSPVSAFTREGDAWVVESAQGRLTARALILATNAYTGQFASFMGTPANDVRREVVPVLSWQMATAPLSDNIRRSILPGRQAMSDTHGDLYFARWDARNRLITGGALIVPLNGTERMKARIGARLSRVFPQIGDVTFDYVWNGRIGMTPDWHPRFHRLGPNAVGWTGCNGRALALSMSIGRELARAAMGAPDRELALPFGEPTPIPYFPIIKEVAPLSMIYFRWNDRREIA